MPKVLSALPKIMPKDESENEVKLDPAPADGRGYQNKVKSARLTLGEKAQEILNLYLENAAKAQKAGRYDITNEALKFLLEHMPANDEGDRILDPSVNKGPKEAPPSGAPTIQIGVALGGVGDKKKLPPLKKPKLLTGEIVKNDKS